MRFVKGGCDPEILVNTIDIARANLYTALERKNNVAAMHVVTIVAW
jgi:hypothetical protein